jgi:hypothetical protein
MNGTASVVICCALTACLAQAAVAQSTIRNTRPPGVTAEAESWYLAGSPITYDGHFYYPAGPRIHFIPSEMIRSGDFRGVPLYSRTTIEPYSIIFVPIGGGMVQPYERRREGELAGTVGSGAPSFPVALSSDSSLDAMSFGPQAPAPPRLASLEDAQPSASGGEPVGTRQPVGTSGETTNIDWADASLAVRLAGAARVPRKREDSPNGIFIRYDNARWFSSGPPVAFDPARFVRARETDGFPVYTARRGSRSTIYVPVVKDATGAVAPYSKRGP